jgi:hypothetical protein
MINWKSIISEYNDKPTLLEWLKLVKKALNESVLESVSVNNVDETTITLSFNFADGTKITTPSIILPRGLTGATGATGAQGATGAPGKDGVSVTGFDTVSDEVVGNETLTTIRAHFSDDKTDEFVVTATNGRDGAGAIKYYKHYITFTDQDHTKNYYLTCIKSNDETPNEQTIESDIKGFVMVVEEMGSLSVLGIVGSVGVQPGSPIISVGFNAATPPAQNIELTDNEVTEL